MTRTYWIVFSDPNAVSGDRFRGVIILDLPIIENLAEEFSETIVPVLHELGIEPPTGGAEKGLLHVRISDVTAERRIKSEHKNRLITDDAVLLSLGSTGRARARMN